MVQLKIYNDDRVRKYNYFPTIKDPCILEDTLLRILNEVYVGSGQTKEDKFDINNNHIANTYVSYYTTSNFNIWGQLPMGYVYNDMVRHIQSQNTNKNFIMTLESISIDLDDDYLSQAASLYVFYEIVEAYIVENYLVSYNYMINNANGVMVVYIPKPQGMLAYIVSVGFNPISMSKWYSSSQERGDVNAIPYIRYGSLNTIVNTYNSFYGINIGPVELECSDMRIRSDSKKCANIVETESINNLRKHSAFDTETKYGNYGIDYNWTDPYDTGVPVCKMITKDSNGNAINVSRFNQEGEYKSDFRLMKRQNDMIKINERHLK